LDYIGAPVAWDIATGGGFIIGIADARIKADDADFIGKISFINPSTWQSHSYHQDTLETYHGTNVTAVAAARGDNAYGVAGICYDCDIVASAYSYNGLFDLANAGAKVINMSWGSYNYSYTNQDKITKLVDSLGVTLVAAAGNRVSYQSAEDFIDAV